MKEVYLLLVKSVYEFEDDITTLVFAKEKDAIEAFNATCEDFREEAEENELEIEEGENYFDAYRDGRASEYEIYVSLTKKVVQ